MGSDTADLKFQSRQIKRKVEATQTAAKRMAFGQTEEEEGQKRVRFDMFLAVDISEGNRLLLGEKVMSLDETLRIGTKRASERKRIRSLAASTARKGGVSTTMSDSSRVNIADNISDVSDVTIEKEGLVESCVDLPVIRVSKTDTSNDNLMGILHVHTLRRWAAIKNHCW